MNYQTHRTKSHAAGRSTSVSRILLLSAVAAVCAVVVPNRASAMWSYWSDTGLGIRKYTQVFTLGSTAPATFWSSQFNFREQPDSGGYIGVQVDGYAFELGSGEIAIFSLWNAVRAIPSPGAVCGEFGGEGVGLSCRALIKTRPGHTYKVSVERLGHSKRWSDYHGVVRNLTTGEVHRLGTIRVPGQVSLYSPSNFIEYFGPTRACADRPLASAKFQAPVVSVGSESAPLRLRATGFSEPGCAQEVGAARTVYARISTGR
jgi:hypothetical protein